MFSKLWEAFTNLFKPIMPRLYPEPRVEDPMIEESPGPVVVILPAETLKEPPVMKKGQLTKNFHIDEFKCHDGTAVPADLYDNVLELAKSLQVLRDELGKPININSGYRTPAYNRKIGGARSSYHLKAMAADIKVKGISPEKLADKVRALMDEGKMKLGGIGRYPTFTHVDVRGKKASWKGSRKEN